MYTNAKCIMEQTYTIMLGSQVKVRCSVAQASFATDVLLKFILSKHLVTNTNTNTNTNKFIFHRNLK